MQKVISVLALLLALPLLAQAQEAPRIEAFGGYSFLRLDRDITGQQNTATGITNGDRDLNGFATSVNYNFNSWLGATGDLTFNFDNNNNQAAQRNTRSYLFLFGPTITYRGNEKVTPFAHALFGFIRQGVNNNVQATVANNNNNQKQFAFGLGGGLDYNITERIALRAVQGDLILTRLNVGGVANAVQSNNGQITATTTTTNQYNLRISTGVVVKLGEQ
jgi:opacity protein-like surface antigen